MQTTSQQASPVLTASLTNNVSLRRWCFVHKYSSLICTLFLLMLCLTGIPLIFHAEIDRLMGDVPDLPALSATQDAQRVSMDLLAANALKTQVNKAIQFIFIDKDDDRKVSIVLNSAAGADVALGQTVMLDGRTGNVLAPPKPDDGFMHIMFQLHVDLFAGLPGTLFLGAMGLLFLLAIVSGVVIYAPFMRKLKFAEVRTHRTKQIRWLDWHNLLGIVTLAWASVVGFTGVINTIGSPMFTMWQNTQMAEMIAPFQTSQPLTKTGSLELALQNAKQQLPNMSPFVIVMPGNEFAGTQHFNIFMRGNTPVTSRLYQPIFLNASSSEFAVSQPMPWYMQGLFISEPLHFGNYGGMPLKIVWLILDLMVIGMLVSGLYLWWKKRAVRQ